MMKQLSVDQIVIWDLVRELVVIEVSWLLLNLLDLLDFLHPKRSELTVRYITWLFEISLKVSSSTAYGDGFLLLGEEC